MGWFALKFLGLPRYLWAALAVAAVIGLWLYAGSLERADDRQNQQIGATTEQVKQQDKVIKRVEQGNEVREQIEADVRHGGSDRLYRQCLRSATEGTAQNCERFLPQRPDDPR